MKAIISIVALAMTFASVLAQELRGGPAVLSDVSTTDAGSEGRDWHPKTKYVSDIVKENDKTKFVVEGHKHLPKTKVVAGTHKADVLNNVKGQPYDNGNDESFPEEHPCDDFGIYFGDCMRSEGVDQDVIDDAVDCLVEAWDDVPVGTDYNMLSEGGQEGFCSAVRRCGNWRSCGISSQEDCIIPRYCADTFHALADCVIELDGCTDIYWSECV